MGFKKYQKSENVENINIQEKSKIDSFMSKTGKNKMSDLTNEELEELDMLNKKENNNA